MFDCLNYVAAEKWERLHYTELFKGFVFFGPNSHFPSQSKLLFHKLHCYYFYLL